MSCCCSYVSFWFGSLFETRHDEPATRNVAPPLMKTRNAQKKTKARQRTTLQLRKQQSKAHVAKLLKNNHATCVHACGMVVLLLVQDSHARWLMVRFRTDARTGKWLPAETLREAQNPNCVLKNQKLNTITGTQGCMGGGRVFLISTTPQETTRHSDEGPNT